MAPKTLKRQSSVANSPKKRGKGHANPMLAGIIATLEGTKELSDNCRDMMVAMAAPSLSTPKSERIHMQQLGVTMIEETLNIHQTKLVEAVAVAQKALAELDGSKASLLQHLDSAKATLETKRNIFLATHSSREEAKAAVKSAEDALKEANVAQKKGDANHIKLEKEKAAIEVAHQEHFKTPMDADGGPHHKELQPFIKCLGLEDSLTSALPSSCLKPKDQRGAFDEIVIGELGKALVAKIAALEKSVADEVTGVIERKAAINSCEAAVDAKKGAEKTVEAALDAAANAQHVADEEVKNASQEWATFEPRVQEATNEHQLHETMRVDFEEGAFKHFATLRDKEAPAPTEEEAAPAGA